MANYDITPLVIQNEGCALEDMTLASGTKYKTGSVLGVVTASGNLALVDSSQSDGSEKAEFILLKDVDATAAVVKVDKNSLMAVGKVNREKLIVGGTDTVADHFLALKQTGILAVGFDSCESYDN